MFVDVIITTLANLPFFNSGLLTTSSLELVFFYQEDIPFYPKTNQRPFASPISHMSSTDFLMG